MQMILCVLSARVHDIWHAFSVAFAMLNGFHVFNGNLCMFMYGVLCF